MQHRAKVALNTDTGKSVTKVRFDLALKDAMTERGLEMKSLIDEWNEKGYSEFLADGENQAELVALRNILLDTALLRFDDLPLSDYSILEVFLGKVSDAGILNLLNIKAITVPNYNIYGNITVTSQ